MVERLNAHGSAQHVRSTMSGPTEDIQSKQGKLSREQLLQTTGEYISSSFQPSKRRKVIPINTSKASNTAARIITVSKKAFLEGRFS